MCPKRWRLSTCPWVFTSINEFLFPGFSLENTTVNAGFCRSSMVKTNNPLSLNVPTAGSTSLIRPSLFPLSFSNDVSHPEKYCPGGPRSSTSIVEGSGWDGGFGRSSLMNGASTGVHKEESCGVIHVDFGSAVQVTICPGYVRIVLIGWYMIELSSHDSMLHNSSPAPEFSSLFFN